LKDLKPGCEVQLYVRLIKLHINVDITKLFGENTDDNYQHSFSSRYLITLSH